MLLPFIIFYLFVSSIAEPTIHFKDYFTDGDDWQSRWITSKSKHGLGKFKLSAGKFYNNLEQDKGIQTSEDAKFYGLSTRFEKFSNRDEALVIQYSVKHEQTIECGGGYVKVFPSTVEPKYMTGDSAYNVMFGPDICGNTKKVHVIFRYKGRNHLIKEEIRCKDDHATHVYALVVKPDNTYKIVIDNQQTQAGSLEDDFDFLLPKEVKDPDAKKPDEWDDRAKINDPNDTKPEDYDKPKHIPDPAATRPEDWDDDMDGEWEAPVIESPEYKGEWKPRKIENPNYSGKWIHPMIPNPSYEPDDQLYAYDNFGVIGLDLWQVKSGTVFDNFLITDDEEFAREECDNILKTTVKGEKRMKDAYDEEHLEGDGDEDSEDRDEL